MPIVTGYVDTPGGHDALVLGAQLARLTGLTSRVVTVHPADARGLAAAARDPRWREKTARVAAGRFARAREALFRAELDAEPDPGSAALAAGAGAAEPEFVVVGPGPVHELLAEQADADGAAVLVVGSTGHGLLGRLAAGGTVARLIPIAPCPVAVAPRGYRHTATRAMTVVTVAYDGTDEADRAAAVAVHLAGRTGAALRFVTVAEDADGVPAATALAQKGLVSTPVEIDAFVDVLVGPVAATLADLPERTDVLVLGSRGYRGMRRLLLGGVAGALVRTARYPVVIVPGPPEQGTPAQAGG
ncbi:universal stress protein [Pseudonocardia sp.]|uniref:universal stress protein n=1 Tax=Pseudonocardia sp. TaxID=60912 RepID=UPI003D118D2B